MPVFLLTHFCLPAIILTFFFYSLLVDIMAFSANVKGISQTNTGKLLFQALVTLLITTLLVLLWWVLYNNQVIYA